MGVSGDIAVASKAMLRSGYRFDFARNEHVPAFGVGLDDGKFSLDYGVQLRLSETLYQQHAIGFRLRL